MDEITIVFKSSLEHREEGLLKDVRNILNLFGEICYSVTDGKEPDKDNVEKYIFEMLERAKESGFKVRYVSPVFKSTSLLGKSMELKVTIMPKPSWEIAEQEELAAVFQRGSDYDPVKDPNIPNY